MRHVKGFRLLRSPAVLAFTLSGMLAAGCAGNGGDDREAPPDTTPPTVAVDSPAGEVSRSVTLLANATDDVGVAEVEFFVDEVSIGADASAPFSVDWDTGTASDGVHVVKAVARDAAGNTATSTTVEVTVANVRDFAVGLSAQEVFPAGDSTASASGTFTFNLATGAVGGSIALSGMDATAAHIHDGFAGVNGPVVVGLEQDAADASRWALPADASVAAQAIDRLLAGALYVNVHSAASPAGEIRGQILPPGYELLFAELSGLQEVPEVLSSARGRAAVTVDTTGRTASIHVTTTGSDGTPEPLAGASAAHLHGAVAGVNGSVLIGLEQDPTDGSHWFSDEGSLGEAGLDALMTAGTYVNVHTVDHPGGEIRGQVVPDGYLVAVSRMSGEQQAPDPLLTAARGTVAVTVDRATGATEVRLNVSGADDATAAHVHQGFAGTNGAVVIPLEKDAENPGRWSSNGATLTGPQAEVLAAGGLYANVHTPDAPAGLIRGQLLPPGVQLVVSHLNGAQAAPAPVVTTATGRAFTTVELEQARLTIHVDTTGVDDATAAHIHTGQRGLAGGVAIGLTQDAAAVRHWSAVDVALTDTQLDDYLAGNLYVNVHTPANPSGEIRGQIEMAGVAPFLYAEIQEAVFDATCATSGCHSGAGAPFGLDLGAGVSHDNLVGQASGEVPALQRVAPGDAPASYLIRKLEGGPDIVGERMPNGLAPLEQATIDRIRAWVNAGALPAPAAPADVTAPTVTLGSVPAEISGTITFTATATDDVGVTLVRWRVNGSVVGSDSTAPYALEWDSTGTDNGAVTIDAQALDAAGNVGTSTTASATVSNSSGPEPFTFTEIQTQIFDMSCALSGCHAGGSPAAGLNLTAPAHARIVGVASSEQPQLLLIDPGDASQSYLIRKLEGGPGISGARMPFGGPFLPQATIDRIRAWVEAGAPND